MFSNRDQLVTNVSTILQNSGAHDLPSGTIEAAAQNATVWLGRYRPRLATATLSGDGSSYQLSIDSLDPAWVDGFSVLRWVEYPTGEQNRKMLDHEDYELFPDADNPTSLHFVYITPASGTDNIRISYTIPHTIDDSTQTVPDTEEPAYEWATACLVCRTEAARSNRTTDSSIEADAIDYQATAPDWLELAKSFCELAGQVLGVDLTKPPGSGAQTQGPAGGFLDWDIKSRWGNPLFYGRGEH